MSKFTLILLKLVLGINSYTYRLAGSLAQKAEKDGVHPKHRIMKYHSFFLDNLGSGDSVLDIGCGNGELAYDVALKAKSVTAIDIDGKKIAAAKARYPAGNIRYLHGDALKDLPDEKFDVIILSNVLEHIRDRVEFLAGIKGKAGRLLIRVPMIDRSWIDVYKKELGLEYRLDPTHYIEYTFEGFEKEIGDAGLKVAGHSVQFGVIWAVVVDKTASEVRKVC